MCSTFQSTFTARRTSLVRCGCGQFYEEILKKCFSGRAFFKLSAALPDTNDLKDFLSLTRDDTFVAISESFIYPTKTSTNFIDEEHRPTLKYNLTLKYHDPSKENQLPQQSFIKDQKFSESHKYLESTSQQSDAANKNVSDKNTKTQICDDTEEPNDVDDLSTRRETVDQSIKRRNVLIQRLLDSQIDPPISPRKMDSVRFVDVESPPPQAQSETDERFDEQTSPTRIRSDDLTSPAEIDMYCRSPKSVSFKRQTQSQDDILAWKTKQQELFLAGLRKKENEYLKSLGEEWIMRRNKEEEKLATKMKKCKLLTEALEHGLSVIRVCNFF